MRSTNASFKLNVKINSKYNLRQSGFGRCPKGHMAVWFFGFEIVGCGPCLYAVDFALSPT